MAWGGGEGEGEGILSVKAESRAALKSSVSVAVNRGYDLLYLRSSHRFSYTSKTHLCY